MQIDAGCFKNASPCNLCATGALCCTVKKKRVFCLSNFNTAGGVSQSMNLIHPKLNIFENIFTEIFPVEGDQAQFNPTAVTEENLYKLLRYPSTLMVIIASYIDEDNLPKLFEEISIFNKDKSIQDLAVNEFYLDIYYKVSLLFDKIIASFTINEIQGLIYYTNCYIALCSLLIIHLRSIERNENLSDEYISQILSTELIKNDNSLLTKIFIQTWIHFSNSMPKIDFGNILYNLIKNHNDSKSLTFYLELIKQYFYQTQELWKSIELSWNRVIIRFPKKIINNEYIDAVVTYLNKMDNNDGLLYAINQFFPLKCRLDLMYNDASRNYKKKFLNKLEREKTHTLSVDENIYWLNIIDELDNIRSEMFKLSLPPRAEKIKLDDNIKSSENIKRINLDFRQNYLETLKAKSKYLQKVKLSQQQFHKDFIKKNLYRDVINQLISLKPDKFKGLRSNIVYDRYKNRRKMLKGISV